jgi:hypothetical protein
MTAPGLTYAERRARLERNPHNIGLASYGGAMCNFDLWRARFEREGEQAAPGAVNPYNAGTMAADSWQRGRAYAAANREGVAA